MDNTKTGALIRSQRKARNMTQLDLARKLNVTDRAVSKWERGLSAPDIALLEPLGNALGLSVTELIRGEILSQAQSPSEDVGQVLDYSRREVERKVGQVRKQTIIRATLLLLCLTVVCGIKLWNSGLLCTIDRCPSPDGENMVTVYGKAFGDWLEFSFRDATALIREDQTDGGHTQIQYLNTRYRGLWWSPDGRKYVVALHYPEKGKDYLALNWLDYNRESNLNAYLSMGVDASELRRYGTATPGIWPEIRYEFLQWGADSASMLIYYTFDDADSAPHEGYFWYNCETGSVKAVLELEE